MNYYFRGFQFKSDQLILIKREKTVSLRANEAKLLTLLLSDPQRVFSKTQILENVWAGKSVAEQSIFQNISNLRNIFGDDAITTHPKKGYQWQIPLESAPEPKATISLQRNNQNFKYLALLVSLAIIISIGVSFFNAQPVQPPHPAIALMPIEANTPKNAQISGAHKKSYNQLLMNALDEKETFSVRLGEHGKSFSQLQASPSLLVTAEKSNSNADFILSTKVKKYQSTFFITFNLLAENNVWQGVINANSLEHAATKLVQHINIVIDSEYLLTHKDNLKRIHAQLKLMHDQFSSDLIVLQHYVNSALNLGLLNEASLLTEQLKLLTTKVDNKYLAEAHLLSSMLLIQQENYREARIELKKATVAFSAINDIEGLADVANQSAEILFYNGDYAALKQTISETIPLLKAEGAHFKTIEQSIILAVYANKSQKITDRDFYLAQAKQLLDRHDFPNEHYSSIYFQQGLFAEIVGDDITAEKYYRWVIALFTAEQEWWNKERAQFHLTRILLNNDRTQEAVELFENEGQLTAKEQIILAGIYQNWHKPKESITLAQQAYSETVLSGELSTSLDAALILVELSAVSDNLTKETYIHYLKKNATPYWLMFTEARLRKLGLFPL